MKTLFFLFLTFFSHHAIAQTSYLLKSAAYWTYPLLTVEEADILSPYGLIIIDLENGLNNHASLERIKKNNPDAKLICYSNPIEFFDPVGDDRLLQKEWSQTVEKKYPQWYLKTAAHSAAIFWPGMVMLNLSALCPKYDTPEYGEVNYGQWMAEELLNILADTIWDGYFMDNGGGNISWLYQGTSQIDANNDLAPDDSTALDCAWSQGVSEFLQKIRLTRGKDFILLANKGSVEFMDILDGRLFENFPCNYLGGTKDNGWHRSMFNSLQTGQYTIFQVADDENLDFVLASALLVDAYVAIGQDNLRTYPQLFQKLGQPWGKAMRMDSLFFREFENGRVEVKPAAKKGGIIIR